MPPKALDLRLVEEASTTNRRSGVPFGGCGKQAMDGLRRRVRHGCLPSRGACPDRGAAASEARAQPACPITAIPQPAKEQKNGRGQCPRPLLLPAVGEIGRASCREGVCRDVYI